MKWRSLLPVGTALFAAALTMPGVAQAARGPSTRTAIKHVVVIVQENHTFDNYFANYCERRVDNKRRPVCDGGPTTYPGTTTAPVVLDDNSMAAYDPNHTQSCQTAEINGGKIGAYVALPAPGGRGGRAPKSTHPGALRALTLPY